MALYSALVVSPAICATGQKEDEEEEEAREKDSHASLDLKTAWPPCTGSGHFSVVTWPLYNGDQCDRVLSFLWPQLT